MTRISGFIKIEEYSTGSGVAESIGSCWIDSSEIKWFKKSYYHKDYVVFCIGQVWFTVLATDFVYLMRGEEKNEKVHSR